MKKIKQLPEESFLKILFAFITLSFFIAAIAMPDRASMFTGLKNIVTQTCKIATNNFDNGGYAGAFLNTGCVGVIMLALFSIPKAKPNGVSGLAFVLTIGFCFWGINILNIWFGILGVVVYCLVKKSPLGNNVNAMLFSSGIAPLISDLLFRYPSADVIGWNVQGVIQAVIVGIIIGFFIPLALPNAASFHKGYDLFSAAVPVGMTAFFLRAVLYTVLGGTLPGSPFTSLTVVSWPICNIFCFVVFGLCIICSLLMGYTPKQYWNFMKDSGYGVDYTAKYGNAAMLMNFGVYGLFIVAYYNAVGVAFNAVTLGIIFCMLSSGFTGSHPRNVLPIMLGYVIASFAMKFLCLGVVGGEFAYAINAQVVAIGVCYASGLSPISGKYGWPFGILAGFLHYCLVTSVPLLHGGFCLYNGGFTAAFICFMLVPVLEHFFKTKEERKLTKK